MSTKNSKRNAEKKTRRNNEERGGLPNGIELHPDTVSGLITLFVLVLAILFTLATFGLAGAMGTAMNNFDRDLLGVLYPLFPLFLFFLFIARITGKRLGLDTAVRIGATLLILMLATFIHLVVTRSTGVIFNKMLWEGGGYLGMAIAYLLTQGLGFWGAVTVASAGILASLLLVLKTSLQSLLMPHRAVAGLFRKEQGDEAAPAPIIEEPKKEKASFAGIFAKKAVADDPVIEKPQKMQAESAVEEPLTSKKLQRKIALPLDLLNSRSSKPQSGDVKAQQHIIQKTLENFGVPCEMGDFSVGPTVTQYTLKPSDGIKLSRITTLSNDLALALAAHPIRIEAPIPGKALVGIEVPNQTVAVVNLREAIDSDAYRNVRSPLRIALGKDVAGKPWVADLAKMPHLLVAGSTGSGKSVCLNAIIVSLLYSNSPDELKLLLVDPKRVEMPVYNNIPHMLVPAVTEVPKTVNALRWAIGEMDRRFNMLSKFGKRDIGGYNEVVEEKMPYIVIIIDELADLMVSNASKEVESSIIRLAQMSRAVGIHLILATQRPSVDVITGLIKANMPGRIAFAVASSTDSRTILDQQGAEKLVGRGDMLFSTADLTTPKRLQGAFVSEKEIRSVTDFIKDHYDAPDYQDGITERSANGPGSPTVFNDSGLPDNGDDPILAEAQDVILRAGKASASLLQRRLKVGYARAARILDLLEEKGVIGPGEGAKPRAILIARPPDMPTEPDVEDDVTGDHADAEEDPENPEENGVPKWE